MEKRTIYKSAHHEDALIGDYTILKSIWYTKSNLDENTYRQELANYFNCVKIHRPKCVLLDAVNAMKAVTVETQTWMVDNFFYIYKEIGSMKMAILTSQDFITSLSIEQTVEEDLFALQTKYFKNEENALKWLKS